MFENRSTQKDVRMWFTKNGYRGDAITFKYLELYAIKPPGWEQIFTFEAYFGPIGPPQIDQSLFETE